MLLFDISKIEIEIRHGGGPSITQGDDMLYYCRAGRSCELLYIETS